MIQENFIQRHTRRLIDHEQYAFWTIIVVTLVPYIDWVASIILALVTLRRGPQKGLMLLIPALSARCVMGLISTTWPQACMDASLEVLPCYAAAVVLYRTQSWRWVWWGSFVVWMIAVSVIHHYYPEWIEVQWAYVAQILKQSDTTRRFINIWQPSSDIMPMLMNYVLGLQGVSLILNSMMSVGCARSLQSKLYYPEGFREELLHFRADRLSVGVLILFLGMAHQGYVLAMNGLPCLLLCFISAGLSVVMYFFRAMRSLKRIMIMLLPFALSPLFALLGYALLGCLDAILDCRLKLTSQVRKTL